MNMKEIYRDDIETCTKAFHINDMSKIYVHDKSVKLKSRDMIMIMINDNDNDNEWQS